MLKKLPSLNTKSTLFGIFMLLGVISLCFSIFLFYFHSISITPNDTNLDFELFSDSQDKNIECSKVEHFNKSSMQVQISYIIGKSLEVPFPYIGFAIQPKNKIKWNCNWFDQITIKVDPKQTNNFTVILWTYIDGFSSKEQNLTWRIFEKDFTMNESGIFTLPINQFVTPIWWFGSNNIQENGDRSSLSQMGEIHIQSHPLSPKEQILRIAFKEVKLSHSPKQLSLIFFPGLIFIFIAIWLQRRLKVKVPFYTPLNVENRHDEEHNKFVGYMAKEYTNDNLTLKKASLDTGLSEIQIRTILKTFYKMSFKEYITSIRMKEAQRLLIESDRNIGEISNLIGYKHPTTFTRIFRESYGTTPKQFRENL